VSLDTRRPVKGRAKMSTWLTSIVINSARVKLRRPLSQVQIALDETGGEQNVSVAEMVSHTRLDPEEAYSTREIAETLADGTSQLSPTLRRTFQLRDVEGFSIRETAHLLGVPAGTVKARLARARMRLKEVIKKNLRESMKRSAHSRQQESTEFERGADIVRRLTS
jgi:RNA polymerase sigma-70 factor, ECF subfamily